MTHSPDLSIVIAAKDAASTLPAQLDSLRDQKWAGSWEVIVVDNGSTDSTRDLVARELVDNPRVRLVEATEQSGAAYARNVGVAHARGERIAFCDADDVVRPGWVAAIGDALGAHSFVAGPIDVERLNEPWLRTAFYTRPPSELEWFADIFPIAATCNMGIRRAEFEAVGGFDTEFLTGQDVELCLRLWAAGVTLTFIPGAVVDYRYRPSIRGLWRRSRQYGAVGPALAKRLDDLGGPTPGPTLGARNWVWLIRKLPTLRTKAGRSRWIVVAGTRVGRLTGSFRARRLLL